MISERGYWLILQCCTLFTKTIDYFLNAYKINPFTPREDLGSFDKNIFNEILQQTEELK